MTQDSKGRKIAYWITTGILGALLGVLGVINLWAPPDLVDMLASLGYPAYLAGILGIAKILAAVAILLPGFPRLKEWAYAGVTIDLVGAAWSHTASGHGFRDVVPPLLVLALAMASWYLRPDDRRLEDN
jgi:uncharacterized membrane protein YphA (DoxX/SURF4 family)